MAVPTQKTPERIPEVLSTIVIIAVVLAVLAGFVRLTLDHWGYAILIAIVVGAAGYIYSQMKR